MNLIWHIVRKDLVRFRWTLLGWVALLAAKYLFLAAITGVFGHPSLYWLRQFEFPMPFYLAVVFLPAVIAYFLVAALVFEDPPAGRDPFWVTRPISGGQLFTAKLLLAVAMFAVVPLVIALVWWRACGFGVTEIGPMAGTMGTSYLLLVLLGLAVASATNGYPRYFVWTLAGLAVVLAALGIPGVFGGWQKRTAMPFAYFPWITVACLAAISLVIVWHRFVIRHFRNSLPLAATLTLLISVWLYNWPPDPLVQLFTPTPRVFPGEENVRVTVASDVRTFLKGGLSLPLRTDGLPDNAVPIFWMEATWRSPDGKVWTVKGGSGGNLPELRRAAWKLLHLSRDDSLLPVGSVNFSMPPKYADRIATEATTVEGKVRIYSSEARLQAEVPLSEGSWRFTGGSFTVSQLAPGAGDVSFIFTTRTPSSVERWRGLGYVALVNRRTGEIIEPTMVDQRATGPHLFNDVMMTAVWLRFKIPDAQWLSDSHLVVVGLSKGHDLNGVVPVFVRPPNHAAALLPKPVTVPLEILKQYAGTYLPRSGTSLVIKEWRGFLELRDSGFFRVLLTPESESTFYAPYASWLFAGNGYQVEFKRDTSGAVTHFVVHQDGRDFIVPRANAPITSDNHAH